MQDGSNGADTGLVLVPLENAPHAVYMQPCGEGDDLSWCVSVEQHAETLVFTSHKLNALTHELQVAAELCTFLQEKSLGHFEADATDGSVAVTDPT